MEPSPDRLRDLRSLNDLDLGALAHKVGATGENLTQAHVEALCGAFSADLDARFDMVNRVTTDSYWTETAMACKVATRGARIRAALPQKASKTAWREVLQSADEAPVGSLVCHDDGYGNREALTLHLWSGKGWHMPSTLPEGSRGWMWITHGIRGPVTLIAENLTEDECRALSGMDRQGALAWCERRAQHATLAAAVRGTAPYAVEVTSSATGITVTSPSRNSETHLDDMTVESFSKMKAAKDAAEGRLAAIERGEAALVTTIRRALRLPDHTDVVREARDLRALADEALAMRRAIDAAVGPDGTPQPVVAVGKAEDGSRILRVGDGPATIMDAARARSVAVSLAGDWSGIAPKPFPEHSITIASVRPEPPREVRVDVLDPLRQPGLLSTGGVGDATPERVVEMAVERIEALERRVGILKAHIATTSSPSGSGVRKRLAAAEAALAEASATGFGLASTIHSLATRVATMTDAPHPGSTSAACARYIAAFLDRKDGGQGFAAQLRQVKADLSTTQEIVRRAQAQRDEARADVAQLNGTLGVTRARAARALVEAEVARLREVEEYHERLEIPAVEATLKGALGTVGHITTMARMVCAELAKARAGWAEESAAAAKARGQVAALEDALKTAQEPRVTSQRVQLLIDGHIVADVMDVARVSYTGAVAPTPAAPSKPQPGDVVPWAEVEAGSLYLWDSGWPFLMVTASGSTHVYGPDDCDVERTAREGWTCRGLGDTHGLTHRAPPVLLARDLGSDPEAWRAAMRAHLAKTGGRS
jgi:hypothetical protein